MATSDQPFTVHRFRLALILIVLCFLTGWIAALITDRIGIAPMSFAAQAFGISMILAVVTPTYSLLSRCVRNGRCRWLRSGKSDV